MSAKWPWSELGLAAETDTRFIKRAYASALKKIDRKDAEVFQELREAYETALSITSKQAEPMRPTIQQAAEASRSATSTAEYEDASERPLKDNFYEIDHSQSPEDNLDREQAVRQEDVLSDERKDHSLDQEILERAEALCVYPLLIDELEDLLDETREVSIDTKREIERNIFQTLSDAYDAKKRFKPLAVEAAFIEDQFGWLTDGIGFNNRFGFYAHANVVLHELNASLKRSEGIDEEIEEGGIGKFKILMLVLWIQFALGAGRYFSKKPELTTLQVIQFTGLFLFLIWFYTRLIRIVARAIRSVLVEAKYMLAINKFLERPDLRWLRALRENKPLRPVFSLICAAAVAVLPMMNVSFI
ncbi:MAG: hypothetical protein ACR2OJ_16105 [Hyphomicrobiales bacterium]